MKDLKEYPHLLLITVRVMLGLAYGAPASDIESPTDSPMDGHFLIKLGHQFDSPLLRLIGRVFLNSGTDEMEKKLTEKLCRLHPCTEWGAWTDCPVMAGFSMVTRSRACNKTTDICTFDGQTEFTTTESKVCGGCPSQYNMTDRFCLKLFTTKQSQADATVSCQGDGGYLVNINSEAKSDAVGALLNSNGYKTDTIWLNGKRAKAAGPWEFTYGSGTSFENWKSTEPSNGSSELCKVQESDPKVWYDRECSNAYMYICEIL